MSEDVEQILRHLHLDADIIDELKNIAQQHETMESAVNELRSRLPFTLQTNLYIAQTMMKHINNTQHDINLLYATSNHQSKDNDTSSHTKPADDDDSLRYHHRRKLSLELDQLLMNPATFHDLGVDDAYIWHTVCNNHKRKVSQLTALIKAFKIYYNEDRAIRTARDKMKDYNPLNLQRIQTINYRIIIQRVLRNNDNINDQLQALKSELTIYFIYPITNHVATKSIQYWIQNNLLIFGYIAKMEQLKVISNSIPYDIVILILEFYSNKHYEYEYGFKWQNIVRDASKYHLSKLSQFALIKAGLSSYFDDVEERTKMAKTLITSMYADQNNASNQSSDDLDDVDNDDIENDNETFAWWDWNRHDL